MPPKQHWVPHAVLERRILEEVKVMWTDKHTGKIHPDASWEPVYNKCLAAVIAEFEQKKRKAAEDVALCAPQRPTKRARCATDAQSQRVPTTTVTPPVVATSTTTTTTTTSTSSSSTPIVAVPDHDVLRNDNARLTKEVEKLSLDIKYYEYIAGVQSENHTAELSAMRAATDARVREVQSDALATRARWFDRSLDESERKHQQKMAGLVMQHTKEMDALGRLAVGDATHKTETIQKLRADLKDAGIAHRAEMKREKDAHAAAQNAALGKYYVARNEAKDANERASETINCYNRILIERNDAIAEAEWLRTTLSQITAHCRVLRGNARPCDAHGSETDR